MTSRTGIHQHPQGKMRRICVTAKHNLLVTMYEHGLRARTGTTHMSTLWPQRETQRTRNEVRWMQQLVQTATIVEQFEHPVGRGQVSTTTRWQVEGLTKVAAKVWSNCDPNHTKTTACPTQGYSPSEHKHDRTECRSSLTINAGESKRMIHTMASRPGGDH